MGLRVEVNTPVVSVAFCSVFLDSLVTVVWFDDERNV